MINSWPKKASIINAVPLDLARLQDPTEGAKYLLGAIIERRLPDRTVLKARIVETESYHQFDPASHTFRGKTARNEAMYGPAGHAYIYFTYGMHWCFNVTAGKVGEGAGILIRATEPLEGAATMQQLRKGVALPQLTNGPAKLAQALAIDKQLYSHDLRLSPLQVYDAGTVDETSITTTTRVGIKVATEELLRFYLTDSPYVSKK